VRWVWARDRWLWREVSEKKKVLRWKWNVL